MQRLTTALHIVLIYLVIVMLVFSALVVEAKTYTQPPPIAEIWGKDYKELGGYVSDLAWSPDGSKIAIGLSSGEIIVFYSNGSMLWENDALTISYSNIESLAWSPDGSKIAVGLSNGMLAVLSASDGRILWKEKNAGLTENPGCTMSIEGLTWTPNGEKIVIGLSKRCADRGLIVLLSALTGDVLWISSELDGRVRDIDISPNGLKLAVAYGTWSGKIVVLSLLNGDILWESRKFSSAPHAVAWSPDGSKIAIGLGAGTVLVLSALNGEILWESEELGNYVSSVAWSPDGSKIAASLSKCTNCYSEKYDGSVVVLYSINGEVLWVTKRMLYGYSCCVAWSPTGKMIAGGGYGLYVFPLGKYTVLHIPEPIARLKITFFDGVNTTSCILESNSSSKLYIDLGKYIVKYYLLFIPRNYKVVGDIVDYLAHNPIKKLLTIDTTDIYTIQLPKVNEFLNKFGKIVVHGPPESLVKIMWGSSNSVSYVIPVQGVLEVYAVPGTEYSVYMLISGSNSPIHIGDVFVNVGEVKEFKPSNTYTTTFTNSIPTASVTTATFRRVNVTQSTPIHVSTNLANTSSIHTRTTSSSLAQIVSSTTWATSTLSLQSITSTSTYNRGNMLSLILGMGQILSATIIAVVLAIVLISIKKKSKAVSSASNSKIILIGEVVKEVNKQEPSVRENIVKNIVKLEDVVSNAVEKLENRKKMKRGIEEEYYNKLIQTLGELEGHLQTIISTLRKYDIPSHLIDKLGNTAKLVEQVVNKYRKEGYIVELEPLLGMLTNELEYLKGILRSIRNNISE